MIYEPEEDSYLMLEALKEKLKDKNLKILEIGVGSGFILNGLRILGFANLEGVDINPEAVDFCKKKKLNVWVSNLFSEVKMKYDVILFNPPYLPKDCNEDSESSLITSGGIQGSEILNEFLSKSQNYLLPNGKIYVLISSITKGINWKGLRKIKIKEKKLFFEKLEVWELSKSS